ncbi:Thrombospondin type 3 repeat family [Aciduliprofundum boonei T469]|nr:Thrombospondin type 3 repeat family [Aciduliprofundum boonei T469]
MGSDAQRDLRGSFSGYIFDNGRVKIEIDKDYARILNSKSNAVLVERFYPLVEINESGKWRAINFGERFINENEHDRWHSVAIGMVYEGKNISVHGFLQYYQKDKFRRYAPLYPSMQLWFSKRTEYRVIWKYEGIKIRHFEVIDNGTGWTRPPYQHGHGRIILYNGTVNRDMRFDDGQDIVIGYEHGRKAFGLNWEKSKKNLPVLSMMNNGDALSMSIESTSQVSTLAEPSYPIPDSGGGGGSDDSDSDGLSDSLEEAGWYIWLCTSGTTWHHIKVFSDPHYRDTDNDGVDDGVEYSAGTNPEDTDTDNDGLTDEQEIDYYGTYGYTWDSDEDGISDNDEFHNWLFMLYLDGDNNLDSQLSKVMDGIIYGLNAYGSEDKVSQVIHILVEYDGRNSGDSARYEIRVNNGEWEKVKLSSLGEVSMNNPNTLSDFVNWAVNWDWWSNRRALIIADHGDGWDGLLWDDSVSGDNYTDMNELKTAFSNMNTHINLVWFDSCFMQMAEVIYQLRGYADMIVGSEDTKWMSSSEYSSLFNQMAADYPGRGIELRIENVSQEIIYTYKPGSTKRYTLSSVWSHKVISTLVPAIDDLAEELINLVNEGYREEIKSIIAETQHMNNPRKDGDFENHSYRDLYNFSELIAKHFRSNIDVVNAAHNVMNAINQSVEQENHNKGDYHGISIFLPDQTWWTLKYSDDTPYSDSFKYIYRYLDFSIDREWYNFISQLYDVR